MRVAPELASVLAGLAAEPIENDPVIARLRDVESARSLEGRLTAAVPDDVQWEDLRAGNTSVRIYRPARPTGACLVYAHGGGWMTGSPRTVHSSIATLASDSGTVIVSVDYRLIPEHRFPAGLDDLEEAFRWVVHHAERLGVRSSRIAIGGSSAGGNLAAAVCRRLRDTGAAMPALQLLEAPVLSLDEDQEWAAARRDVPPLAAMLQRSLLEYRMAGAGPDNPDAAPLRAATFENLPSAAILVGEVDPLRGDALDYARRLISAGVSAEVHLFPGVVHGTENFVGILDQARRWHRTRCRILAELGGAEPGEPQ